MKLKFKLVKFDRLIVFEILEQSEKFWNKTKDTPISFSARNGISVVSDEKPLLRTHFISLFGSLGLNCSHSATITFDTNEQRDERYSSFLDAIEEWSNVEHAFQIYKHYTKEGNIYSWGDNLKIKFDIFGHHFCYEVKEDLNSIIKTLINTKLFYSNNAIRFSTSQEARKVLENCLNIITETLNKPVSIINHGNGVFEV